MRNVMTDDGPLHATGEGNHQSTCAAKKHNPALSNEAAPGGPLGRSSLGQLVDTCRPSKLLTSTLHCIQLRAHSEGLEPEQARRSVEERHPQAASHDLSACCLEQALRGFHMHVP